MANRRKRLERIKEREREQKMLDELASDLVSHDLPIGNKLGGIPSQHTAIAFCIQAHLSGDDKHYTWPDQIGWIMHRHRYREFAEMFYPLAVTSPDGTGLGDGEL